MTYITNLPQANIKAINSFLKRNKYTVFSPAQLKAIKGPDPLGIRNLAGIYIRGDMFMTSNLINEDRVYPIPAHNEVLFIVLKTCHQLTNIITLDFDNNPVKIYTDVFMD